jgi:hypothetical protein
MRNISAKELLELAEYHRQKGDELLARGYEQENIELQREMDTD